MDSKKGFFFCIILTLMILQSLADQEANEDIEITHENKRKKKILPLFSQIRFQNGPCVGNDGLNGTCYTGPECDQLGGTRAGSCALTFGICCTFSLTCGSRSSQNCTYFTTPSNSNFRGACSMTICPKSNNICQLRLDFVNFQVTGPSTISTSEVLLLNGVSSPTGAVPSSTATQCLTDTFTVTSPDGCAPPTICGINTGEHMYVDASPNCNELAFQLGNNPIGVNAIASRSWQIKVTQYSCDYDNLAPDCCTQYFFGSNIGTVQTYNYAGDSHLANQDQNICVRRERNNCRICWTTQNDIDFQLSGMTNPEGGVTNSLCCNYGSDGENMNGFDCVFIPGAEKATSLSSNLAASRFCGRSAGLATTDETTVGNTICSTTTPFNIRFRSDAYEVAGAAPMEATKMDLGFRLTYIQQSC